MPEVKGTVTANLYDVTFEEALNAILMANGATFRIDGNFIFVEGEASMSTQSQISATVSSATKEELDRFTESHGLKKNYVVEQALLFFMTARRELPDEALVPARIVLDNVSFDRIATMVERAPAPSKALRNLMRAR
jgi:S-adenosylmethionine:diacylglycerol 3-amino-3-carboxypropyl transferase